MEWNHLPVHGGIYDQHPRLLDEFAIIFQAKAQKERQEAAEREMRMRNK